MNKIKEYLSLIHLKSLALLFVWAFIVNFIVETLGRFQANGVITGNIWGGLVAIFKQPYVMLYGSIVIMFTLSFSLFFKRKYFALIIISSVWLIFGISNFVLLSYRVTPFSAVDLKLIDAALGVLTNYASKGTMIAVIILAILLIVVLVLIAKKAPVEKNRNIKRAVVMVALTFLITFAACSFGKTTKLIATEFPNLADAYIENGFAYCFYNSLFNTGISKPKDYSSDAAQNIVKSTTEPNQTDSPDIEQAENVRITDITDNYEDPNVIFLQLESFFDLTQVKNLQLSEDPVPYFRSLIESCPSGYLSMPCIGAGTANTEFEVITGMNLDFFGPGEYPYKTILKTTSCESLAFNFHDQGYATHVMHNNRASFYDRHKIFKNLGFDEFTSFELMNITEYTQNGWAKDKVLTNEILKVLNATKQRDLIYTISVQAHGKYPSTQLIEDPQIKLLSGAAENKWYGIEYYANQIKEMDDFLKELTTALEAFDEPVILVGYGDHLPGLGFTDEDMKSSNMKQTQYFVWTNQDTAIDMQDEDIEAYQLSSRICEYLGFDNGVINAYHQDNRDTDSDTYLEELELLEYDILYGEKYVYGGKELYEPSEMKFGVANVTINSIEQEVVDDTWIQITGKYFTKYSRIYVNGEYVDTEFIDENHIRGSIADVENGASVEVQVCQSYKGTLILQESNTLAFTCTFRNATSEDFEDNNNNFFESDEEIEEPDDIGALIEEGNNLEDEEQQEND